MRIRLVFIALLLGLSVASLGAQTGNDLLQQADARRDQSRLADAVQIYERIVRDFPANRPLKAKALMRLADSYRLMKQTKEQAVYERIIKELGPFPDQADVVKTARARLAALKGPPWTKDDGLLIAEFKNTTGDPIFDDALSGALGIRLEQSPYLNLLSPSRLREALAQMGRPQVERITHALAQEICARAGAKGVLLPSISMSAAKQYLVALDVLQCRTGEVLARAQVTANSAEQLRSSEFRKVASALRARLGESPESIQRFDNEEALTNTSYYALKAYREGQQLFNTGNFPLVPAALNRAVSYDPEFASAYHLFSLFDARASQPGEARRHATKAFELREHASEKDRLRIVANYEATVRGDWDNATTALQQLRSLYREDAETRTILGDQYQRKGMFRDGVTELEEALRLDPGNGPLRNSLLRGYLALGRLGDARALSDDTAAKEIDYLATRVAMFGMFYLTGDIEGMQRQLDWLDQRKGGMRTGPGKEFAASLRAKTSANLGQMAISRPLYEQASLAPAAMGPTAVAERAQTEALFGNSRSVRPRADVALTLHRDALAPVTLAHALAGNGDDAAAFMAELEKAFPTDSIVTAIWIPAARAALDVQNGNGAAAIELLKPAAEYEPSANSLWAIYVRGLAHLQMKSGREAAAEFQKILDHRGVAPLSPLYPASKMRIAEAYALSGDVARARAAYEEFFTLWKDADPDVQILVEARAKFAALPGK